MIKKKVLPDCHEMSVRTIGFYICLSFSATCQFSCQVGKSLKRRHAIRTMTLSISTPRISALYHNVLDHLSSLYKHASPGTNVIKRFTAISYEFS